MEQIANKRRGKPKRKRDGKEGRKKDPYCVFREFD
jgi:hypothetical protein